jgi:hypothetical protein
LGVGGWEVDRLDGLLVLKESSLYLQGVEHGRKRIDAGSQRVDTVSLRVVILSPGYRTRQYRVSLSVLKESMLYHKESSSYLQGIEHDRKRIDAAS